MKNKIGYVYMITSPTMKIYVGSTDNTKTRWGKYYKYNCKSQCKLYNSFIKYGVENHIFEVIWSGSIYEMYKYETLIGWGFNVLEKESGLNLKLPKLGEIWSSMSQETKDKISKSLMGNKSNKGYKHTEETKKKMSDAKKGEKCHLFGTKRSQEIKDKISNSHKGFKHNPDSFINVSINKKKAILQFTLDDILIKEWDSALTAGNDLNISKSSITQCCKGKFYKSVGGFKWKYKT